MTADQQGDWRAARDVPERAFSIQRVSWREGEHALRRVREQVFVREQGVPVALEWDGRDPDALHLLAQDAEGAPIGTARMLADGQIGRMAVLPPWRGKGVGSALLAELLAIAARQHYPPLFLNAQIQVVNFYRRAGFEPEGEVFMDAGIPHRRMRRTIDRAPAP